MKLPSVSRQDISDATWKWRCKISNLTKRTEKTLSDFSSDSASLMADGDNGKPGASGAGAVGEGLKESTFGITPAVKTLYEGRNSSDSFIDWVDYPPKQLSKSAAKAQDRVAIKVFKVKDKDKPVISGRFALKYHSLEVQNAALVAFLEPIVKKENVHLDVNETATFTAPFRPLYFCYDDIVAKCKALSDSEGLKQYVQLLIKVLDELFAEIRAKKKNLLAGGLVAWKIAWTYFPRDSQVISWANNCELLCKTVDTVVKKKTPILDVLVVKCKILKFNGEAFVWEELELEIPPFEGNKPVTELPHYPVSFLKDSEEVKTRLLGRGKKVLDYQCLTYCSYSGVGIYREDNKIEKHNIDSRVLIDVVGYNRHHLAKGAREGKDPESRRNMVRGTGRSRPPVSADPKAKPVESVIAKRLTEEEQAKNKKAMMDREQDLMFMMPLIEGYALKNKLWVSFYVEDIKPMVWNDKAFEHLVYDEQQKDLVLSFVENHGHAKASIEDVIVGKGQGLIILLSGPPGTGKTLTAEAVADRTHRPLFYLQAEDLGINAAALGANVKRVFEMATEWNAVILLDEADVFMAERHPHDIARNELVSIFLRELEYFRGIIFLTTNLYNTIDSAFRSRVSLHLLFTPLTADAREVVWRKFLNRLPKDDKALPAITEVDESKEAAAASPDTGLVEPKADVEPAEAKAQAKPKIDATGVDLNDEDLKELAAWHLNGREIKNAVRMVKSWCDHKGYELTLARLENGIRVTSPHASKHTHENDTSLYDD